jgi:MFS family permease
MYVGRFIFGLGGESFTVANSALLAEWFRGGELAFAFGVNLSIARLGSVINNVASPALTSEVDIVFACWFGTLLCGLGVVCVLVVFPIDHIVNRQMNYGLLTQEEIERSKQIHHVITPLLLPVTTDETDTDSTTPAKDTTEPLLPNPSNTEEKPVYVPSLARDLKRFTHLFWVLVLSCVVVYGCVLPFNNISSSLLLERDFFRPIPSSCHLLYDTQCPSDPGNEAVSCPSSSSYQPPLPINFTSSDVDCTDSYWSDTCTVEYCNRLSDAESKAAWVMSIPYIISAALSPPAGYLVDHMGGRALMAMISPMIIMVVHLYLGLTKVDAVGPLVGQGLAYTSFVSVLWPAILLGYKCNFI